MFIEALFIGQKLERTQISLNGGMSIYTMNIYPAIKNNELMKFVSGWN